MSREEIRSEILTLARKVVDMDWESHGKDATFDQIGVESLDLINLSLLIEQRFGISLIDISPYDYSTVDQLMSLVQDRVDEK